MDSDIAVSKSVLADLRMVDGIGPMSLDLILGDLLADVPSHRGLCGGLTVGTAWEILPTPCAV